MSTDDLGDIWDSSTAHAAYKRGQLRTDQTEDGSDDGGETGVRVVFRNCTPRPLVLSVVDEDGAPDEYWELKPFTKGTNSPIDKDDKMELTESGCAYSFSIDELQFIDQKEKLSQVVGGYRPSKQGKPTDVHVVVITERNKTDPPRNDKPRIKDRFGDDEYDGQYDVNVKLDTFAQGLGDVWHSDSAHQQFSNGELKSQQDAGPFVRICVRNCTSKPLVMAWINEEGAPENHAQLKSKAAPDDPVSEDDEVVQTYLHHAFAFAVCKDIEQPEEDGALGMVIGGYRPTEVGCEEAVHLVTIHGTEDDGGSMHYQVQSRLCSIDPDPMEASDKKYRQEIIGGWPCMVEKNWYGGSKKLRRLLNKHMEAAVGFLPEHAREALRENTPLYINRSMEFGPEVAPVIGEGMEYHPSEEWLESVGMSIDKAKCIEMYEAEEYFEDAEVWGVGGSLLHELAHAYHDKIVEGGLDNKQILACYRAAMHEGLYDNIKTKEGKDDDGNEVYEMGQGYHCQDESEYFAELSTAFLGGLIEGEEYNKNQPFNRHELRGFDPRAYEMLQQIWKVTCDQD